MFQRLSETYDLSAYPYPVKEAWITLTPNDGSGRFKFETGAGDDESTSFSFACAHKYDGYDVITRACSAALPTRPPI